jgi:hypothetical protein
MSRKFCLYIVVFLIGIIFLTSCGRAFRKQYRSLTVEIFEPVDVSDIEIFYSGSPDRRHIFLAKFVGNIENWIDQAAALGADAIVFSRDETTTIDVNTYVSGGWGSGRGTVKRTREALAIKYVPFDNTRAKQEFVELTRGMDPGQRQHFYYQLIATSLRNPGRKTFKELDEIRRMAKANNRRNSRRSRSY